MAELLPTKELLDMIEERIPGGRFLTTAALLTAVMAVIVGSCVYLYRAIILPAIHLLIDGITTGKISPPAFASLIGSMVCAGLIYFTLEWLHRGTSRLMKDVLNNSTEVLERNAQILTIAGEVNTHVNHLFANLRRLENRVAVLEGKQPPHIETPDSGGQILPP